MQGAPRVDARTQPGRQLFAPRPKKGGIWRGASVHTAEASGLGGSRKAPAGASRQLLPVFPPDPFPLQQQHHGRDASGAGGTAGASEEGGIPCLFPSGLLWHSNIAAVGDAAQLQSFTILGRHTTRCKARGEALALSTAALL